MQSPESPLDEDGKVPCMPTPSPPRRVIFYPTCLVDSFFPEVGEAAVHLIEEIGAEVLVPKGLSCCGLPHYNNGFREESCRALEAQMNRLKGTEPIIVPSGSCGWMLKCVFPSLFPNDPWLRERADEIATRVIELSQFLNRYVSSRSPRRLPGKVVYHDSCHLLRGMGERDAPRALLDMASERREEMPGSDRCCGFGGSFAIKFPDVSCAMLDEKIRQAERMEADWIVAADAGCLLQIRGGIARRKSKLFPLHLAQALAGPGAPGWPDDAPLQKARA